MGRRGWLLPSEPCHREGKLEESPWSLFKGQCPWSKSEGKPRGGQGLQEATTSFSSGKLGCGGRRGCIESVWYWGASGTCYAAEGKE